MSIRVGIAGYGHVGRGVETALAQSPDMELKAVFTRRDPKTLTVRTPGTPVLPAGEAKRHRKEIDVMILCGSSAKDLPEQGPELAALFSTVDSYDVHASVPDYLSAMDKAAVRTAAVISAGWDPGLFSMTRMLSGAILPHGADNTFWGRGVSQGHSAAARRVEGVIDAVQYTIPIESAVSDVRGGSSRSLTASQRHVRECYVVPEEGADRAAIEHKIRQMPHYFAEYDTKVHFVTREELALDHAGMPHGGFVIRTGTTGESRSHKHVMEFSLKLGSNPEFTASVLVAYARAAARLAKEKQYGAKTVLDIPLTYLSPRDRGTLIKELI